MGRVGRWVATRALCLVGLLFGGFWVVWLLVREPFLALARAWSAEGAAGLGTLSFTQMLTGLCACALLVCSAWLVGTTSLVAFLAGVRAAEHAHASISGHAHHRLTSLLNAAQMLASRTCPRHARRLVVAVCGIALGAGATPAIADSPEVTPPEPALTRSETGRLDGLGVPDRISGAPAPVSPAGRGAVRVTRGDSLWSLSTRLLPDAATDGEVTTAWHALYHANLDLIGPDPDVIFPGTTLQVPRSLTTNGRNHP